MLALSRKKGESIIIGDNIEITVLEVQGEQIKIGIEAPKNIPIYRKEIYLQIKEENKIATKTNKENIEKIKGFFKKI
ncbi:carbon storage regulator CsrA [Defluviitalea phaphyphila]|uniref:carbon storage regulator CsrA n=1 Tax=Defluviitalea phaphyphila TaxID=1473580 RepID=UPI000730B507|nr:carbon storage regulator CsrA [Defluviitalea phaphyphila]